MVFYIIISTKLNVVKNTKIAKEDTSELQNFKGLVLEQFSSSSIKLTGFLKSTTGPSVEQSMKPITPLVERKISDVSVKYEMQTIHIHTYIYILQWWKEERIPWVSRNRGPCIIDRALEYLPAVCNYIFNYVHMKPYAFSLCTHNSTGT